MATSTIKAMATKAEVTSYTFINEYSSLLAMINDQVSNNHKTLPFTFVKAGTTTLSDTPSKLGNAEFIGVVDGDSTRLQVVINQYGDWETYEREIYDGSWRTDSWTRTTSFAAGANTNNAPSNLNNCIETGLYFCDTSTANTPDTYGICMTISTNVPLSQSQGWVYQTFFSTDSTAKVYKRKSINNSEWTNWITDVSGEFINKWFVGIFAEGYGLVCPLSGAINGYSITSATVFIDGAWQNLSVANITGSSNGQAAIIFSTETTLAAGCEYGKSYLIQMTGEIF